MDVMKNKIHHILEYFPNKCETYSKRAVQTTARVQRRVLHYAEF